MGYRYRVVLGAVDGEPYAPVRDRRWIAADDFEFGLWRRPGVMFFMLRLRPGDSEWEIICSGEGHGRMPHREGSDAPPLHAEGWREDLSRVIYNGKP